MKRFRFAVVCALVLGMTVTGARADIMLSPSASSLISWGNQTSTSQILAITGLNTYSEFYKKDVGQADTGIFAASYNTTLTPPSDPSGGSVTWETGHPYIHADPIYFLVKDGRHVPAWYLFDISAWNGRETIQMSNFWPNGGSISHIAIYGTPKSVPDGGVTLMLLGGALVGLETLRRKLSV